MAWPMSPPPKAGAGAVRNGAIRIRQNAISDNRNVRANANNGGLSSKLSRRNEIRLARSNSNKRVRPIRIVSNVGNSSAASRFKIRRSDSSAGSNSGRNSCATGKVRNRIARIKNSNDALNSSVRTRFVIHRPIRIVSAVGNNSGRIRFKTRRSAIDVGNSSVKTNNEWKSNVV